MFSNFFPLFTNMSDGSKDCWECRLTSGCGLLAAGCYVVYQSIKLKTFSRHAVSAIGYGLGFTGFLRLFALPPFKSGTEREDKKIEGNGENDETEYIIGKFSSRHH